MHLNLVNSNHPESISNSEYKSSAQPWTNRFLYDSMKTEVEGPWWAGAPNYWLITMTTQRPCMRFSREASTYQVGSVWGEVISACKYPFSMAFKRCKGSVETISWKYCSQLSMCSTGDGPCLGSRLPNQPYRWISYTEVSGHPLISSLSHLLFAAWGWLRITAFQCNCR